MAVGDSGTVLVVVDPEFKRELRAALKDRKHPMTMKAWFIQQAEAEIRRHKALKEKREE